MGACCRKLCKKSEGESAGGGPPPDQLFDFEHDQNQDDSSPNAHHHFVQIKKTRSQKELDNMTSLVHEVLDTKDFDEQLTEAGNKLVVVDFFATWCGPCKIVGPKVDALAGQFTDVIFLKVDVDECEEIATRYKISCMPTFLFFKASEKVADFSGANAEKVKELILQHK